MAAARAAAQVRDVERTTPSKLSNSPLSTIMKIQRVLLRDIRCFHQLEITLGGQSALIVGDNGDGKSTFLRSLAMGLCDDSSAAALFRDLHGKSARKRSKGGRIEVNLRHGRRDVRTVTEIKSLKTFERVEQTLFQQNLRNKRFRKLSQRTFPWNRILPPGTVPAFVFRAQQITTAIPR